MKTLVQHLVRNNWPEIMSRSLRHCHTENVYSIMLLECPGKTIRLFYADANHYLWHNHSDSRHSLSIAFHPHHCALTIVPVFGVVYNWVVKPDNTGPLSLRRFKYRSKIKTGAESKFMAGHYCRFSSVDFSTISPRGTRMEASDLHTVYVPRGERAAWLVFEGVSDPNYKPVCWSNAALDEQDFSHLYKPVCEIEVCKILFDAGLL